MNVTPGTLRSTATLAADLRARLDAIRTHIADNDLLNLWRKCIEASDVLAHEAVGGAQRSYTFYDAPVPYDDINAYDSIAILDDGYITLSGTDRDGDAFSCHLPFDFLIEATRERAEAVQREESLAWARRDAAERGERARRAADAAAREAARLAEIAASYPVNA